MKIIWTEPAILDLETIKEYIAKDSEYYASRFVEKVIYAVEKLIGFPRLGRQVPELNKDEIRELLYNNYRIIYKLNSTELYILAVIHAARELNKLNLNPWEII